jgi:hypothetical protein
LVPAMFELVEAHQRDYFMWLTCPMDSAVCKGFEGTGWAFVHGAPWDTVLISSLPSMLPNRPMSLLIVPQILIGDQSDLGRLAAGVGIGPRHCRLMMKASPSSIPLNLLPFFDLCRAHC